MTKPPVHSSTNFSFDKFLRCAAIAVGMWYALLCLMHYFAQRPLWNDEECILISLKSFSVAQIFSQPLAALQVFPRLYLFLIQQIAKPFDFHLLALRLLSLVCMLGGFILWLRIARCALTDRLQYLTFVLSWPASAVLLYYSAELKQYSMDVLVAAVFILFLYHQEKLFEKKSIWPQVFIVAAIPALLLFSYVSIFFLLLPLYNSLILAKNNKKAIALSACYAASLLVFVFLSYQYDVRLRPEAILTREWRDYFVSVKSLPEFFQTLGEGTNNLFSRWFVERPKVLKKIGLFFISFGFFYLFRGFFKNIKSCGWRLTSLETISFVIFVELFILGVLKKYPFTVPRTSLFFCPIALLLAIKGIASLKNWNISFYRVIQSAYVIFLVFLIAALSRIVFVGELTFRPILW